MWVLWEMKNYDKESLARAGGHECCSAVCFKCSQPVIDEW